MSAARRFAGLVAVVLMTSMLVSCTETKVAGYSPEGWKFRKQKQRQFKPVDASHLELMLVSKRLGFMAGESVTLTFRLVNRGEKTVNIPEWLASPEDNLKLYYRPLKADPPHTPFQASEWTCVQPELPPSPEHFELTLNPRNSVLVTKRLPFIRKMAPPPQPQMYQVIVASNLASLQLHGETIVITVK